MKICSSELKPTHTFSIQPCFFFINRIPFQSTQRQLKKIGVETHLNLLPKIKQIKMPSNRIYWTGVQF